MELILLENILNLGNIGDKVTVKNGYGRNFLLKKGKALRFNKDNQLLVSKRKDELNKKNNEIPSTPKVTFKFRIGIHKSFVTNWKVPTDFLNPPHINTKIKNGNVEKFKAMIFNNFWCSESIQSNNKIPISGIRDV